MEEHVAGTAALLHGFLGETEPGPIANPVTAS
jgi:hypothetical protein